MFALQFHTMIQSVPFSLNNALICITGQLFIFDCASKHTGMRVCSSPSLGIRSKGSAPFRLWSYT